MSDRIVAEIYVDSQNFLRGFWPDGLVWDLQLREIDWHVLMRVVVDAAKATTYSRINYYDAFPGGIVPRDTRDYPQGLGDIIGNEVLYNPNFVIRPGYQMCTQTRDDKGNIVTQFREKVVDTQIVADMQRGALKNEFDIAILFSTDLDLLPGIEAVLDEGKRCLLCGWGWRSMGRELREQVSKSSSLEYLDLIDYGGVFIQRVYEKKTQARIDAHSYALCELLLQLLEDRDAEEVTFETVLRANMFGLPLDQHVRSTSLRNLERLRLVSLSSPRLELDTKIRLRTPS